MKKIAVVLISLLAVACSSTPKTNTPNTETSQAPQAAAQKSAPASAQETESGKTAAEAQANQMQSVYFDFDESVVKPEYREAVQKQAEFIKAHKSDVVSVEGNCDERGSAEYNLGLGQRRADAVKKLLLASGVRANQIKTASWGKEKPRLLCHEEKCWKENRRADFVYGE